MEGSGHLCPPKSFPGKVPELCQAGRVQGHSLEPLFLCSKKTRANQELAFFEGCFEFRERYLELKKDENHCPKLLSHRQLHNFVQAVEDIYMLYLCSWPVEPYIYIMYTYFRN